MFRLRMVGKIIRQAGLGHISLVFLLVFLACSALIWALDPAIGTWGDSLWFCFQAVTTIGFGDVVATSLAGRVVLVCLSVVSVFYLAVVTGVVVAYCTWRSSPPTSLRRSQPGRARSAKTVDANARVDRS